MPSLKEGILVKSRLLASSTFTLKEPDTSRLSWSQPADSSLPNAALKLQMLENNRKESV
jgi:hypothetical protein